MASPENATTTTHDDSSPFAIDSSISDQVLRNAKGGVLVTKEQIRAAFDFFDVERKGVVTMENLKSRLGIFYKDMSTRDYRVLLNNESELTEQTLCDLLLENDIADYDPVAEAFRAYDPDGTGFVSLEVLSRLFDSLGYGKLSEDDLRVLVATADADKDGQLNLSDFRKLLAM
ncbi:hypothetical protein, variant 1 [Aphanomyces invadans]|uniref:EF-hand domain-containing protein n=2 Tax=Aphanomyces invadans TaxID=157072 RepID=A0A024TC63_9STRA|nr:hypothetical protein, variant 1 [Aphanomyces invadans]ETV91750.1 hypothetical protein, variant 1 [Aphanomyces invadans]|eukprot:XP_008879677.1 hypothetical protein, variant 1 [Aphanomyces invadans]